MRNAGYQVVEKWSCEFSPEEKQRALHLGVDKKVPQLIPKDAFYGGRTEAVNLHAEACPDKWSIEYYDVTSEYPFVNAYKAYPTGHPTVLLKHQLPQTNEAWKRAHFFGAVKCSILPPRRLLHPLLPFRHNGALIFPLCCKCCVDKVENFCTHSDAERTLHGTWVTIEIDKAIEMGYELTEVCEVWHFSKQSTDLFRDFINSLYKAKLEASGFPANVVTEEEKVAYVEDIWLKERVRLDGQKIAFNPGRRQMAKILLNSFWVSFFLSCLFYQFYIFPFFSQGKFAQRENLSQVAFINGDDARFNEIAFSDNMYDIRHISPISEDMAYLVYRNLFNKPNPKGNIFIAAFTTAHARLHLYKAVEKLGTRVLYMDTDSVVFKHQPNLWAPTLSSYLGEWTSEISSDVYISSFTTCGPKNYSYETKNRKTGATDVVMKVKGLRLSRQANDLIDNRTMVDQVRAFATLKRVRENDNVSIPAKRVCLAEEQRKMAHVFNAELNNAYANHGASVALEIKTENEPLHGPCNCCKCVNTVQVQQIQFRKNRRDGYVETVELSKEYRLVLNKRWLVHEFRGKKLPFFFLTFPFGYTLK
jgi:hypothetical protein